MFSNNIARQEIMAICGSEHRRGPFFDMTWHGTMGLTCNSLTQFECVSARQDPFYCKGHAEDTVQILYFL